MTASESKDAADPAISGVPLVIGVTGHRDLVPEQTGRIQSAVVKILEQLAEDYPNTPLLLLTPLAEGADRLAAEATLEWNRQRREAGRSTVRIAAPLPLPLEAYRVDFEQEDSETEFQRLLDHPDVESFLLESATPPSVQDLIQSPELRTQAYDHLAHFLARNCHVLIAMWEGNHPEKSSLTGGTEDVVNRFLHGVAANPSSADDPLDPPDGLLLVDLRVARQRHASPPEFAWQGTPCGENHTEILRQINTFNVDVQESGQLGAAQKQSREWLLPAKVQEEYKTRLEDYLSVFGMADALSIHRFQRAWFRYVGLLVVLPFVAIVCFEAYCHLFPGTHPLLASYLAVFGAAACAYVIADKKRFENKYLVYRSLAESLRVQVAMCLAGECQSVGRFYDRMHRRDIEWVRQALKGVHVRQLIRRGKAQGAGIEQLRLTIEHWVVDQKKWMKKRSLELAPKHVRYRTGSRFLVGLSIGLSIVLLFFGFRESAAESIPSHSLEHAAIVLIVLLLAAAAITHEFTRRMGHAALAQRYHAMSDLFTRAEVRIQAILDQEHSGPNEQMEQARSILQSLAREALSENVGWLLFRRDHPLEIHTP